MYICYIYIAAKIAFLVFVCYLIIQNALFRINNNNDNNNIEDSDLPILFNLNESNLLKNHYNPICKLPTLQIKGQHSTFDASILNIL